LAQLHKGSAFSQWLVPAGLALQRNNGLPVAICKELVATVRFFNLIDGSSSAT
jgi:hypothetical protein